jgi:CoA:oxalate CoA-transferase
MAQPKANKVLQDIRILDFSRYGAGPYGGMLLADMGAEVIKVERPGGEDDRQLGPFAPNGYSICYGIIFARNKKGITLNLRSPRGRELALKLVERFDVVLHNFPPGTKEANVLDYEALKKINPDIIVAPLTGFGQDGPWAERSCFDPIAQAESGGMSYCGFPGNPPTRSAIPYVDLGSGLAAALGIMFALYHREKTGQGQLVDIALMDVAVSFMAAMATPVEYELTGQVRPQQGNQSFYASPSNTFKAKDGWVFIATVGEALWRRWCQLVDRPELVDDPRFQSNMSRYQHYQYLNSIAEEWIKDKTVAEVMQILDKARIPCGRVNSVVEVMEHPQVKARQMLVEVDFPEVGQVPLPGIPIKLSLTPGGIERRAPMIGEHNQEIYGGLLGLPADDLTRLEKEGVI